MSNQFKSELRATLHKHLDTMFDRLDFDGSAMEEFCELTLATIDSAWIAGSNYTEESVVLTRVFDNDGDGNPTNEIIVEYCTRSDIEYQWDRTLQQQTMSIQDRAYYYGDGTIDTESAELSDPRIYVSTRPAQKK